jgi:hypothetical protein
MKGRKTRMNHCKLWIFVFAFSSLVDAHHAAAKYEEANPYAKQGTLEVGGTISFDWEKDTFSAAVGPTVGYFITDRVELSALFNVNFERDDTDVTGGRRVSRDGDVAFEPSYHYFLTSTVLAFGGLGFGVAYDDEGTNFEMVPRFGLNIEIGSNSVLTPAVRIPIVFKSSDTWAGASIEIGFSGAF